MYTRGGWGKPFKPIKRIMSVPGVKVMIGYVNNEMTQ